VFWLMPRPLRDAVYNFIARNRYKWFGKKDRCMVPDEKVKGRFVIE
jgi:predicted DCC family thiol-disulfide oxidoreductase YuxK